MRRGFSAVFSLLILLVIAIAAVNIYNKRPDIKSAVDSLAQNAKEVVIATASDLKDSIAQTISGNSNGSDNRTNFETDKPAIPVDTDITSSTDINGNQESVSPAIAAEDLESVWGKTGVDGLSVYEYGKSLLSNDEKKCYIVIANGVRNLQKSVTLNTNCSPTQIKKVYSYFTYDHAEVFYIKGVNLSYTGSGNSYEYDVTFSYGYNGDKNKIASMRSKMGAKALNIVNSVSGLSTDLKKEKAIHDALIEKCSYDTAALKNPQNYPDSCSAYGALVNNKAICQGYAQAMKIMLSSAGIKSLYVTGSANGDSHAWNMASIGGKWKFLDATFDDPVFVNQNGDYSSYNTVSYTYFNFVSISDHILGHYVASDPFYSTSENYEKMPSAVK